MVKQKVKTRTKQFPYRITVAWSAEDEVYIARIPKLEGILGLDESDPARATHQVIERGWDALATFTDNKRALPEPDNWSLKPSGQFYVRLLPEIHASLREWAEEEGLSLNALIGHILTAATTQHTVLPPRVPRTRTRRDRHSQAA
jgi:predicted HicB family RNase H-like nuclease